MGFVVFYNIEKTDFFSFDLYLFRNNISMSDIQTRSCKRLPPEILAHIFVFLDIPSLCACSLASTNFSQIIDQRLWKELSHRDYLPFLNQVSLKEEDLVLPVRESEINIEKAYFPDATLVIEELITGKYDKVAEIPVEKTDWKEFYSHKYQSVDLNGYWVSDSGKNVVRIYQKGYHVIAKKLTGDENIPAGKLAWEMHLDGSLTKGKGKFQLTAANYESPKLAQAYLQVVNKDVIKIRWLFQDYFGHWYTVEFINTRAGCVDFDSNTMNRKVELLRLEKEIDE